MLIQKTSAISWQKCYILMVLKTIARRNTVVMGLIKTSSKNWLLCIQKDIEKHQLWWW